ncbi:MAG: CbiX/SirB N-terminal domain-containing protein [Chromatiales bacterium]|jgi:sirohydrochlorin ferrochelatase
MTTPTILLVDNGSSRPDATLNLRRLAAALEEQSGRSVHPVSLQHAHRISPSALDGRPAATLEPFLREQLRRGVRDFLVLPLFFGLSRALTAFIPETVARLEREHGPFSLRQAEILCPLPEGEPRLARILCDNVRSAAGERPPARVVLVDHGSPRPRVTAVRTRLAEQMGECLPPGTELSQAVMERREGRDYDFNGRLLEEVLTDMARADPAAPVALALLFLSPGRHAGPGGDIEGISRRVEGAFPGFRALIPPLVGDHPGLVEILVSRLRTSLLEADPQRG